MVSNSTCIKDSPARMVEYREVSKFLSLEYQRSRINIISDIQTKFLINIFPGVEKSSFKSVDGQDMSDSSL